MNKILAISALSLLVAAAALSGCARDTDGAGVKPIGVGFDPGDLFPGPEKRGGVIDLVQTNTRGPNLDFAVNGFFGSGGAFVDVESDPFDALMTWGWFFSPSLTSADEYSALSPKGPDLEDACFVQSNNSGPVVVGARTVDVGDAIEFTNADEDPDLRTSFVVPRNPQDYPVNTSSVFIYYIGTAPLRLDDPLLPDNWPYGQIVQMQFDGALPPENAPVASIPQPSDVADEAVGKEAGHPTVFTPDELTGILVSNRLDDDGPVPVRYEPISDGLPNPSTNDGVLHLKWDEPTSDEGDSHVTIAILLLAADEPYQIINPFGSEDFCLPAEPLDFEVDRDDAWFIEYDARKRYWCDQGFEPDIELGNDETGLDQLGEDTCHDELDNNEDGFCDEGGCADEEGMWLLPDPNCARHVYQTATCGSDGFCRDVGGDRTTDGHMAELICTAEDDGEFVVPADQVAALLEIIDVDDIDGAVLKVARTSESLVQVPTVRDQVGNVDNINPIRLRASQVVHARFDWE